MSAIDGCSADHRQLFATPYARADGNPLPVNQRPLGLTRSVSPGYFRVLDIPLLAGRDFNEHDKFDSPLVVILSNSTAKKLFPNENPLGRQIFFGVENGTGLPAEVIGVVGDVRSQQLDESERRRILSAVAATQFSIFQRARAHRDQTRGNVGNCPVGPRQDRQWNTNSATKHARCDR